MSGGRRAAIRRIVVRVDGSDGAMRAVWWSVGLARATGGEVVAAHAKGRRWLGTWFRSLPVGDVRDQSIEGRVPLLLVCQLVRAASLEIVEALDTGSHARTIASSASPPPSQSGRWGLGRTTHPGRDPTADGLQGLSCEPS